MVFLNLEVKHKKFGLGTVVSCDGKYLTIEFDGGVRKSFVYPDAFESYLTLSDGSVNEEIIADLGIAKAHKQAILAKKEAENRHSMTHGIVIPGKEMSLDSDSEDKPRVESEEN